MATGTRRDIEHADLVPLLLRMQLCGPLNDIDAGLCLDGIPVAVELQIVLAVEPVLVPVLLSLSSRFEQLK